MVQNKQKSCNFDVHNIVISKLIKTKNISMNLIGYLDDVMRKLVSILSIISEDVKTLKIRKKN